MQNYKQVKLQKDKKRQKESLKNEEEAKEKKQEEKKDALEEQVINYGFYSSSCQLEVEGLLKDKNRTFELYNHFYNVKNKEDKEEQVQCHAVFPINLTELRLAKHKATLANFPPNAKVDMKPLPYDDPFLLQEAFEKARNNYDRKDKIFQGLVVSFERREKIC
jgi:hypothetical protein